MKLPTMVPVQSSNIHKLGWSAATGLVVRFAGGSGYYSYPSAPKHVFDTLVQAESVGKAFQQHVRGQYPHRQHGEDGKPLSR